ncbi:hypothetical protein [Streptomyces sp. NPDC050121]
MVSALHRDIEVSSDDLPESLSGQDRSAQPRHAIKDAIQGRRLRPSLSP